MAGILRPWKFRHLPQVLKCGGKAGRTCWQHQKVLLGRLQLHGKEVEGLFPVMAESQVLLVASTSCVFSPWQHCMALSGNLMEGWMEGWAKDSGHHLAG